MKLSRILLASTALYLLPLASAVDIQQYHRHDFTFRANVTGNPFDVTMSAEFVGPNGVHLTVPAFYDGDSIWKVRFSPTEVGQWSMTTTSSVPALNGQKDAAINCTPNRHPNIHGSLQVDASNPYHFRYQDGTRYFDLHHTADDTFDKIDPAQLRQNVAAWTAMLAVTIRVPAAV